MKYASMLMPEDTSVLGMPVKANIFLTERANARILQGEPERALKNFNKACEHQPDIAQNYVARGNCLTSLGELDSALDDFNRAVELEQEVCMPGAYYDQTW